MKLKIKLDSSTSFMKVRVGQFYEIIRGWNHSDWSICLDLPTMVTATWKAVNYFTIIDDEWSERHPPSHRFDLSPLHKHRMTKLDELIAEDYFSEEKKKQIRKYWLQLKKRISELEKELDQKKDLYERLDEAIEMQDIDTCEEVLKFLE